MNDDFIHQFEPPKPPRPEFMAALHQRISHPGIMNRRTRLLRAGAVSFAMLAVIAAALLVSPAARALAGSVLQQLGVGGYSFVEGSVQPTVSPEEQATARAFGKPMIQPASDAAAASQLAGFPVLAPSYLPGGYTADNQPGEWTVSNDFNGMTASIAYHNQASDDHLNISEQMFRPGEPNTVLSRPEIQEVTVRGQPGAWMPSDSGKNMLAWEENGITYMIVSNRLSKDEMLKIAESLGK